MNNEEQQFRNEFDARPWNAADRLRANVNPSDCYTEMNVFWVPVIARRDFLKKNAKVADTFHAWQRGEPFEGKMARFTAALGEQFKESARLEAAIRSNLAGLGYEL